MNNIIARYQKNLSRIVNDDKIHDDVAKLFKFLKVARDKKKNIFICGNGGSAGNSNHIANDFIYGASRKNKKKFKIESLSSNSSVITCLANDEGYEHVYSKQIESKATEGDFLIVLSGSGNSKNVINAIKTAKKMKIKTFCIVGFDGGKCKKISKEFIHTKINDMQISEDMQLIIFHMCMQIFSNYK